MKDRTLDEAAAELRITPGDLLDLAHQGRAAVVVESHALVVEYFAKNLTGGQTLKKKGILSDRFRSPSEYDLERLLIANLSKYNHRITGLQPTAGERQRFADDLGCRDSELFLDVRIDERSAQRQGGWPTALLVTGEEVARLQHSVKHGEGIADPGTSKAEPKSESASGTVEALDSGNFVAVPHRKPHTAYAAYAKGKGIPMAMAWEEIKQLAAGSGGETKMRLPGWGAVFLKNHPMDPEDLLRYSDHAFTGQTEQTFTRTAFESAYKRAAPPSKAEFA